MASNRPTNAVKEVSLVVLTIVFFAMVIGTIISLTSSSCNGNLVTTQELLIGDNDGIINGSITGADSKSYSNNYETLINNALLPKFNTTKSYTVGGISYITHPEYDSSTSCELTNLKADYNTTVVNFTNYEVRTDIQSELGIVLAQSSNYTRFAQWVNFLSESIYPEGSLGVLPPWVVYRTGDTVNTTVVSDSASDGSARIAMALWIGASNPNFPEANRTQLKALAEIYTKAHLKYEIIYNKNTTRFGDVYYFPFAGKNAATYGLGSNGPHYYVGYFQDEIKLWQMAYESTGNSTYDQIARNITSLYLELSLLGDTDGDGFGVLPFNFNYNVTQGDVKIRCDGSVNSYHCNITNPNTNTAWDDSDAPRAHWVCDALRQPNYTSELTGIYENLSTYCFNWQKAVPSVWTPNESCLQYFRNGTCSTSVRTGMYENGLGAGLQTFYNSTLYVTKINEILTHFNWDSTYVYDTSACGNGLSYRGIRATKAVGSGIGLDNFALGIPYSYESIVSGSSELCTETTSEIGTVYGLSLMAIVSFLVIGCTIIALLFFIKQIKPLFSKKTGLEGLTD